MEVSMCAAGRVRLVQVPTVRALDSESSVPRLSANAHWDAGETKWTRGCCTKDFSQPDSGGNHTDAGTDVVHVGLSAGKQPLRPLGLGWSVEFQGTRITYIDALVF